MDSSKKYDNPSPEETANIFSKLFFCWLIPVFKRGNRSDLQVEHIYSPIKGDLSEPLGDTLEQNWEKEVKRANRKKKSPSLKRTIFVTFYKRYSFIGIIVFTQFIILKMLQPLVLAGYIKFYDTPISKSNIASGWLWGTGVVVMQFVDIIITHYVGVACLRTAQRIKISCASLVYRKLLKLNRISLSQTTDGYLTNLLTNDLTRFDLAAQYLHYIWITPVQAVVAVYLMYRSVGIAGLAGMLTMTLQAIPLQGYLSSLQGKFRLDIALRTDHRVKLISEIISSIKVIKMYAWEKPFEKIGNFARRLEIDALRKTSIVKGIYMTIMSFSRSVTLYITIITYVLLGNRLTAYTLFSVVGLLASVHQCMSTMYPQARSSYAEVKVTMNRLEKFLLLEENTEISNSKREEIIEKEDKGTIKTVKVNASWLPNPVVETLIDINLEIAPGTLCCVVGSTGSGKSSLLQLFLRELPINQGRISISGSVAYASQEPWLFVSSVRDNILFGRPYLKSRYNEVIRACALERDFKEFPHGDKTLVGEKGISLSGGQKARINLARAVYFDADIYLLDDPLSGVDTKVAKHLFDNCVKRYLKNKTRILVTHQLQFLKGADKIIILNNGRIQNVCTYNELTENELLSLNQGNAAEEVEEKAQEKLEKRNRVNSISSYTSSVFSVDEPQETQALIERGIVSRRVYMEYLKAGGTMLVILFLPILFIASVTLTKATDLWLTYWTNVEESTYHLSNINSTTNLTSNLSTEGSNLFNSTETPYSANNSYLPHTNTTALNNPDGLIFLGSGTGYIIIYTVLVVSSVASLMTRALLSYKLCLDASTNLHNRLFSVILQVPMRFFYINALGGILHRFTGDVGMIDETLPLILLNGIQVFEHIVGTLIMVFIITPSMIVPAILLGISFYYLAIVYLRTTQNVNRLQASSRAPILSHVSASLNGMDTIRSFQAQRMVAREFDLLQDQNSSTYVLYYLSSEAFGFYLEFLSALLLTFVTYQFLIFRNDNTLSANVGLVISQTLTLNAIQYGIRIAAIIPSCMTSVERVLEYINLDKEGPWESLPTSRPDTNWPHSGQIIFSNVYVKYAPDEPPVLENLNLEINPGEKVGIVGRTGAGKSTFVSSLYRLTQFEGKIIIDDVDISTIGLKDLRSNISIVPQDPILFSSSIRYNLDPFEKVTDEKLWHALDSVELKEVITDLNMKVSEGGSNFSVGQKQLICLARAIVRNNKILLMDEATANIDNQTDLLIQKTIRNHFKKCTVITVAHRLNTIMDSDRVLVMDAGHAVEFEHPHKLLQNPDGFFTMMVKQTGAGMEATLRKIAQEGYENKFIDKNDNFENTEKKEDP